jgi:hypothetical protein
VQGVIVQQNTNLQNTLQQEQMGTLHKFARAKNLIIKEDINVLQN